MAANPASAALQSPRRTALHGPPWTGLLCLLVVFGGLALGHSLVVLQDHLIGPISTVDTVVSMALGFAGICLVWVGLHRPETQATALGYLGGSLIWCGIFEWTWRYFGHWLQLAPVTDNGIPILMPGLQMIQATSLIVLVLLVFFGANKDTRCRMFMWFHRNFRLRPGRMTPGYERQHARTTAIETVFLIWFIYICAIAINDPRLIRYDSVAAMAITVGFVVWGIYLATKLVKIRGVGPTFRYAIPTGHILWLPIEAFSRWGLYPEIWIKPLEYGGLMLGVLALFIVVGTVVVRGPQAEAVAG
jgi:hypothetical protein